MSEWLVHLFESNVEIAYILSILLNVILSIVAVVPSVFLTAANISVFGLWEGTLLSFIGEMIGSIISFQLYRFGFKKIHLYDSKANMVHKLQSVKGKDAFFLIVFLRLLPFVPSGFVTISASLGSVSLPIFTLATFIGKLPSILLEAYSVFFYLKWDSEGKFIITIIGFILFAVYVLIKRKAE